VSRISEIVFEFERTRRLGERAMAQLAPEHWHWAPDADANSIAILVQHLHGNMRSRWTDFLSSDGEKPTRRRDAEFEDQGLSPEELRTLWDDGWSCCLDAVRGLDDSQLQKAVTIRGESLTVSEALLSQLSHYSYHVGQLVQTARHLRGPSFESLTIPRGRSGQHTRGSYKSA
jgi:hypothetical protein